MGVYNKLISKSILSIFGDKQFLSHYVLPVCIHIKSITLYINTSVYICVCIMKKLAASETFIFCLTNTFSSIWKWDCKLATDHKWIKTTGYIDYQIKPQQKPLYNNKNNGMKRWGTMYGKGIWSAIKNVNAYNLVSTVKSRKGHILATAQALTKQRKYLIHLHCNI